MSIVIGDKEFDPRLKSQIAAFIDDYFVDPDFYGHYAEAPRYGLEGREGPNAGYRAAADSPGAVMFSGAPMPTSGSAPKRKAGILESASELYGKVRESVRRSKSDATSDTAYDAMGDSMYDAADIVGYDAAQESAYGAMSPDKTVEFEPIRVDSNEFERASSFDANDAAAFARELAVPESGLADSDVQRSGPDNLSSFAAPARSSGNLQDWLDQVDEPFSTTLLLLIDEKGLSDVDVYKRAHMSRQLFSRIRSDALYRPAKKTVLALGIALELSLGELRDLLERAGFALSRSSKRDLIVEYFVMHDVYDLFAINEALYEFDQPLI